MAVYNQKGVIRSRIKIDFNRTGQAPADTAWDAAAAITNGIILTRAALTPALLNPADVTPAVAQQRLNQTQMVILLVRTGGEPFSLSDATDVFPDPAALGMSEGAILRVGKSLNLTAYTGLEYDNQPLMVTGNVNSFVLATGESTEVELLSNAGEHVDFRVARKRDVVDGDTSNDFVFLY